MHLLLNAQKLNFKNKLSKFSLCKLNLIILNYSLKSFSFKNILNISQYSRSLNFKFKNLTRSTVIFKTVIYKKNTYRLAYWMIHFHVVSSFSLTFSMKCSFDKKKRIIRKKINKGEKCEKFGT